VIIQWMDSCIPKEEEEERVTQDLKKKTTKTFIG
jgi:hypothetical protein